MRGVSTLLVALLPLAGFADESEQAIDMLGWSDDAAMTILINDVAKMLVSQGTTCGSKMTQEACAITSQRFLERVADEPLTVRTAMVDLILPDGREQEGLTQLAQELAEVPDESFQQPVCATTPLDRRCTLVIDAMMFGGIMVPFVEAARADAAGQVDQFYRDGSPFDG